MSDYSQVNDYSAKDALASGNPEKLILGSDIDDEFAGLSTAIATKYDSSDLASQANAEAETSNVVLMTPLRVANWADYNAGVVGDLQAFADPNADRILFWDDSAGAAVGLAASTGLAISGTNLVISSTAGILEDFAVLADPGADRIFGWDESADAAIGFSLGTGLTTSGTTLLIDTTVVPRLNVSNIFTDGTQKISVGASTAARLNLAGNGATSGTDSFDLMHWTDSVAYVWQRAAASLIFGTSSTARLTISSGGNFDFASGTVTTNNITPSEVGYKGLPVNTQAGNYTMGLTDAGKVMDMAIGTGAQTLTIPANGSVAFPVGTVIRVWSNATSGVTVAITTDTLYLAGSGFATTGSRTIAYGGVAVLEKRSATSWFISGVGVS